MGTNTYAEQVYTRAGMTKENLFADGKKGLHIGSGKKTLSGATTIDILDLPGVDVVHDLDSYPWPFPDNEFDLIFAHSVFEHLEDVEAAMNEMWRILKPGGRILIAVPYFRCPDAFTDPTHTHFFTTRSLDYFIEGTQLSEYQYSDKMFKKIGFWFGWPLPSRNPVTKLFKSLIYRYPRFYDSHLSLLFPMKIIVWELEVAKN